MTFFSGASPRDPIEVFFNSTAGGANSPFGPSFSGAATPSSSPAPSPRPRTFRSRDGLVTYDSRGNRLDSLGNVARPSRGRGGATSALQGDVGDAPVAPGILPENPYASGYFAPLGVFGPGAFLGTATQQQNPFATGPAFDFGLNAVAQPNLTDQQFQRNAAYFNTVFPWYELAVQQQQDQRNFAEQQLNNAFQRRSTAFDVAGRALLPGARRLGT